MTEIVQLLGGILIAGFVFAATFFAAAQVYLQTGWLRRAQAAAVILTIGAMACLSLELWTLSQVLGGLLVLAAATAFVLERRFNRILPLFHIAFGAVLAAGIPFGG